MAYFARLVRSHLAALRFFYIKTLKKAWSIAETPYAKGAVRLPSILSQEEVTQLIDSALTPYHRILLMTLYAKSTTPGRGCGSLIIRKGLRFS